LARSPRRDGEGGNASLIRALAQDFGFEGFDPFDCDLAAPWTGARSETLQAVSGDPWRTNADTLERLELHALALVRSPPPRGEGPGVGISSPATPSPTLPPQGGGSSDVL